MVIRVICVYRFQIDNGPQEMLHVGRHTTAKARAVTRITASNLAPPRRERIKLEQLWAQPNVRRALVACAHCGRMRAMSFCGQTTQPVLVRSKPIFLLRTCSVSAKISSADTRPFRSR